MNIGQTPLFGGGNVIENLFEAHLDLGRDSAMLK